MQSIPVVYIRSTDHFGIGLAIGRTFKHQIQTLHHLDGVTTSLQKFYNSTLGKEQYHQYLDVTAKCFPEVIQELRGLADGSGLSFEDVFLNQLLSEVLLVHEKEVDDANTKSSVSIERDVTSACEKLKLRPFQSSSTTKCDSNGHTEDTIDGAHCKTNDDVTHCTDILVNNKGFRMISHNEDWGKEVRDLSFLVHVTLESESRDSTVEEFVSFVHPGELPGLTFGMNKNLVLTINTLLPVYVNRKSVPVAILLRKLLSCQTIEECVGMMKNKPYGCAYGINVNIASIRGNHMCTLEVYPEQDGTTTVTLDYLDSPESPPLSNYSCHCNHYIHTPGVKELECTKSRRIESRVKQFKPPENDADVRRILGDVDDVTVQVYKDPSPENEATGSRTVATAVFNITERKLDVYKSNPSRTDAPCVTLPFL